ncbi:MAG: thrombospondin type 3 repeat-containing protein [Dehalococcoidia bacterium]
MRDNRRKRLLWTWLAGSGLGLLAVVLALALAAGTSVADPGYNPTADASLSNNNADANADVTTNFNVRAGDYNYSAMVAYTPADFYVAGSGDAPIGAKVGTLHAVVTLGLLNQPCGTPMPVDIDLYHCSTNTANTVSFDDQFIDYDANGLPDGCDKYPVFLKTLFPGKTPHARMWGMATVAGLSVSMNIPVFEPGTSLPGVPAAAGYPLVTVLNDPTAPTAPSAITDFCAPLATDIVVWGLSKDNPGTAANESGAKVRANPECGGTYTFSWWTASLRDADGDGLDNSLDTCPFDPNTGVDDNGNGIDDACDTSGLKSTDVDNDGYSNRGDNCPQVANADQQDTDDDDIGDLCDIAGASGIGKGPNTPDGTPVVRTLTKDVNISGPVCVTPTPVEGTPTPGEGTPTPGVAITLATGASAGDTQIVVTDVSGLAVGDLIRIGSGATAEECTITAIDGTTLTLDCTLEFDHAAGEPVEKVSVEPTPTEEPTEFCPPVFPGLYNGRVLIEGVPAASGYQVTASIDGVQWSSTLVSGGRYAMDIPDHMPSTAPCFEGGTIDFAVNGMPCEPSPTWSAGINNVDLSCAPAPPPETPTPETPTPPVTPPATPPATPTVTPVKPPPSGAGGLSGSGPGLPVWGFALAGWAGLSIVAGLGTLLAAKRG